MSEQDQLLNNAQNAKDALEHVVGLLVSVPPGSDVTREQSDQLKEHLTGAYNALSESFPLLKRVRRNVYALQPGEARPS